MKAETPAIGIMKTSEFGDSKFYKVVCGCGQPDHDVDFEVEASDTGINVNTYVTAKTNYWTETTKKRYDIDSPWLQEWDWFWKDLVNGLVRRVKLTWEIWTKGYVKTESIIAMSEQQALNYAETIKSAIQDVKDFKDEQRWKADVQNRVAKRLSEEQDCV
jgi:DNA-directed RNA polymerase alpha subunit